MSGMKESYSEGMANHAGLGSYAGIRKDVGGTLIEVRADRVFSREIRQKNRGADGVSKYGRQNRLQRRPMLPGNPARSKTSSTLGNGRLDSCFLAPNFGLRTFLFSRSGICGWTAAAPP